LHLVDDVIYQAITYSAMQIVEKPDGERSQVYVIVDI